MDKLIDAALGLLQESMKAWSREVVNTTLRLLHGFSALLLALLPAHASSQLGVHELHPMPQDQARVPSWTEFDGVSSFNIFLQDYYSDSGSDHESPDHGLDGHNFSGSDPPSPAGRRSRRRRGRSAFWKRCLQQLFAPFRILRTGSRGPAQTKRSSSKLASATAAAAAKSDESARVARTSSSERFKRIYSVAKFHLSGVKDYVMPKQSGDSRRGVIEDVQLLVELAIERAFEVVRNIICLTLSPFETLKLILWWFFSSDPTPEAGDSKYTVEPGANIRLGDSDPTLLQKPLKRRHDLNTDGRTCQDVITSLGYPYEALPLTTEDGHILLLERIPRPDSQKVVYLQHGLLDSSLGWVSNGVVGSQAFAAYDQGYDVFLGNFRGLASRDQHVNPNISARSYWNYSVNEHGTQDIPAMLEKIHEIKMDDLKDIGRDDDDNVVSTSGRTSAAADHTEVGRDCNSGVERRSRLPYALCGVAHSLGGASLLMYVVLRRLENRPHRLSRLILLSPAGFHGQAPALCKVLQYVVPLIAPVVGRVVPGLYIPTRVCRALFNKLARDFQSYPAIGGLLQALLSVAIGGDSSNWVGALAMSHYNMDDMPGVSFQVALHLLQMMRAQRFVMFDFGSAHANVVAYGAPEPLDVGAHYGVIDIPVDLVAGVKDCVIPCSMVRQHFAMLKNAGCAASYDEFEYAHLDFTFSHREELLAYVMSRLLLVTPPRTLDTAADPGFRDQLPPTPTPVASFKAKSFKHQLNSLLSSRKPRSRKQESGLEGFRHSSSSGSSNSQLQYSGQGIKPGSPIDKIADPDSALEMDQVTPLLRSLSHDPDVLSAVTAGSVATNRHEESFREPRSTNSPASSEFSRTSPSEWMPPSQGRFLAAPLPQAGPDMARTAKLEHNYYNCDPSITKSEDQVDRPISITESLSKSSGLTKEAVGTESQSCRKIPSSSRGQLSNNRQRSITGLILCTLSNCYAGPTMLVEDSDE